jgi:predicted nucleotidyltransferase
MNLSSPISSVIPSSQGAVLAVLARAGKPLSGRKVADLTEGRVSQPRVNQILQTLTEAGLVLREDHPPAKVYTLNHDHVAAEAIVALADQWSTLLQRMRDDLAQWAIEPVSACLFGSAARGEAGVSSDIDVLLVAPDAFESNAPGLMAWDTQVDDLVDKVHRWSGNACEVLQLTRSEVKAAVDRDDRLVRDLKADAIPLQGRDIRTLLRKRPAR